MKEKRKRPAGHGALSQWLNNPGHEIAVGELPLFFRTLRISFIFRRPPDIDTGFRLLAAVRGALGRQLKKLADERLIHGDKTPCAFHGLFADHDWIGLQRHFAKPFVIWVTSSPDNICVEVSLFGQAGFWRDEIIDAMSRVMISRERGGEGGITMHSKTRARRIWPLVDVFWRVREGYPVPSAKKAFIISSITPIVMSGGNKLKGGFDDLLTSLCFRLAGLARWHDVDAPDLISSALIARLRNRLVMEGLFGTRAEKYERRSISFGRMVKSENGIMGHWYVRDYPEEMWPVFVLGTLTNFGFDVSQGAGRYVISDP